MTPPVRVKSPRREAPQAAFVVCLVAASGFAALVYQVVWERTLRYNFGGDSISSAIVTGTFLLGLGVGAVAFGRWHRRAFVVYALVEAGIGAYALVSYRLLGSLADVLGSRLGGSIADTEGLRPIVVVASVVFLLPPCVLMGGTLPLIFNCFVRPGAYESRAVGALYGLNTAGAALGVLAAPFLFLNRLSIPQTLAVVGGLNLGLGAAIWWQGRRRTEADDPEPVQRARAPDAISLLPLLGLAFVSGLVALAFEVVLVRAFFVLNPSSPYNFPAVLMPFLLAMALGGVLFTRFRTYTTARACRRIGRLFLAAAIGLALGVVGSVILSVNGSQLAIRHEGGFHRLALHSAVLAAPLPLFLSGVFPLLLRLASPRGRDLPGRTGPIYLANAAGACAGALGVQFLGFPALGTRGVLTVLFGLASLTGAVCLVTTASDRREAWLGAACPVALGALLVLLPAGVWRVFTLGIAGGDVEAIEGVTGIAMIEWGPSESAVFVNGQYMSAFPEDSRHVQLASLALVLPRRERVLLLGLGGGGIVRELVADPVVGHVTAVDWSYELPVLLERPRARRALGDSLRSGKVSLCRCDARVAVRLYAAGSLDVVIDNLAQAHWVGATSVKSTAYFAEISRVLGPRGVFVYKANYGGAREAILAGLVTTFGTVLEHKDGVVLASNQPIAFDRARADAILAARASVIGISGGRHRDWLLEGLQPVTTTQLRGVSPVHDDLLIHEYRRDPLHWLITRLMR